MEVRSLKCSLWVVAMSMAILPTLGAELRPVRLSENSLKLYPSRDLWVSSYRNESAGNMGRTSVLKLKTIQEMLIIDFSIEPIKGRQVVSAELYFHSNTSNRELARLGLGPQDVDALRKIGISTVASDWVEGNNTSSYRPDPDGHGACFDFASYPDEPWAWKGSKLWDVIMGNGFTLHHHTELKRLENRWWKVSVAPYLISALVSGASYGLCVMDESGQIMANSYVHSREARGFEPYLVVSLGKADTKPPRKPENLRAEAYPTKSTFATGALRITFTVPQDAFAYIIELNGKLAPRWQIPFAGKPGTAQEIILEDLQPDTGYQISVRAVDACGNISAPAKTRAKSSTALEKPQPLQPVSLPVGREPELHSGRLRAWAVPELTKVDPVSGRVFFEGGSVLRRANPVWNGREVSLESARGEIAAFSLVLECPDPPLSQISVKLEPARLPFTVELYRTWYVQEKGWQAEYAVPLDSAFSIPTRDNAIHRQKNQSVWVDVIVPSSLEAGEYRFALSVSAEGVERFTIPVKLKVFNVVIPEVMNFVPELNCYSGPGEAGSEYWFDSHRLAHKNRCTINRVPYSQNGRWHTDLVPRIVGRGKQARVADWTQHDRALGPLLDGSAFKDNPRSSVPIPVFYLPFHENYPSRISEYYRYDGPKTGRSCIILHALYGPRIEEAFAPGYAEAMKAVIRQFAEHYRQKGWNKTLLQMYLNNKYNYRIRGRGSSWWLLDEPYHYDDWMALRYFSQLFHEAIADVRGVKFVFRGDISRPQWQFDRMNGLMEMMYVGGGLFDMLRRCRIMKEEMPTKLMTYGSCNPIGSSNFQSAAWCLKAYIAGADGVLPWQSLAGDRAFRRADRNGLIVDGGRFGVNAVASLRLKALRRGAQDVELLRILQRKMGWNRDQIGTLVASVIPLESGFQQQFLAEAAPLAFKNLSSLAFASLKHGVLSLLSSDE